MRKAPGAEIELDVGAVHARVAAREPAGADAVAGERPGAEKPVLDARDRTPPHRVADLVERDWAGAAKGEPDVEMVLQLVADIPAVGDHADPVLAQQAGRADAGKLQQLR